MPHFAGDPTWVAFSEGQKVLRVKLDDGRLWTWLAPGRNRNHAATKEVAGNILLVGFRFANAMM